MIKAYAKSDIGKVRDVNQDSFYISKSLDDIQLFMLADGMGGYNGGEIASKLAIKTYRKQLQRHAKRQGQYNTIIRK